MAGEGTTRLIMCRNAADVDLCGVDCAIEVPASTTRSGEWIKYVVDRDNNPEWFVVLRTCVEHEEGHAEPYCSIACFVAYHAQHAHVDE